MKVKKLKKALFDEDEEEESDEIGSFLRFHLS